MNRHVYTVTIDTPESHSDTKVWLSRLHPDLQVKGYRAPTVNASYTRRVEELNAQIKALTRERDDALAKIKRLQKSDAAWRENMLAQVAAMRMVRQTVEYVFGPAANLPSEEAILLNGPEPHHEAEAIAAALVQVKARHSDEIAAILVLKGDKS